MDLIFYFLIILYYFLCCSASCDNDTHSHTHNINTQPLDHKEIEAKNLLYEIISIDDHDRF